jgi:hypothetical protein
MGSFSDYAEVKVLDHVLKNTAFTVPTNLYLALCTATVNDGHTGGTMTEVSNANNYSRVQCNSWAAASSRATSNSADITFPEASGSWGTVTDWAILDGNTHGAGNIIAYGSFTTSKSIVSGNIPKVNTGDLDVSFNAGGVTTTLANDLLDHVFKVTPYAQETNLYVGLATTNPGDTGSQTGEPSGNSYARVNHNNWDAASSGHSENTGSITFPTATGSWGTITHVFIADASTSGNTLLYGAVDVSQLITTDDIAQFTDGQIDINLD